MTRSISLIDIMALAGLALVPAALGTQQYGDAFARTQHVDFWNYDRQTGAKIADTSPGLAPQDLAGLYSAEGIELVPTPATSSGDELEWLQFGIGLGAGILLTFGLVLGLRMVRIRPLAH
jgi:hypothetical protein